MLLVCFFFVLLVPVYTENLLLCVVLTQIYNFNWLYCMIVLLFNKYVAANMAKRTFRLYKI